MLRRTSRDTAFESKVWYSIGLDQQHSSLFLAFCGYLKPEELWLNIVLHSFIYEFEK